MPQTGPVSVFVLSGVRLYAEGLMRALGADPRFEIAGSAPDPRAALVAIERLERPPDVALVDVAADGRSGARVLVTRLKRTRVIALAVREVDEDVIAWAETGVDALVTRDASLEQLCAAILGVVHGEAHCSPRVAAALLRRVASTSRQPPGRATVLTDREADIAELIAVGLSNKEIAASLVIELSTVKNHVHHLLEKLGASSRGQAAAVVRSGAVTRPDGSALGGGASRVRASAGAGARESAPG